MPWLSVGISMTKVEELQFQSRAKKAMGQLHVSKNQLLLFQGQRRVRTKTRNSRRIDIFGDPRQMIGNEN